MWPQLRRRFGLDRPETMPVERERTTTERRVQFAEAAVRAYTDDAIDRLRNRLERRHQFGESAMIADADARIERLRNATERRAQSAELSAQAYADNGLATIVSGLRAVNKIVAGLADKIASDKAEAQQTLALQSTCVDEKIEVLREEWQALRQMLALQSTGVGDRIDALREELQASRLNELAESGSQIRAVEQRVEFVRREVFYEMQAEFMRNRSTASAAKALEPKVVNPEKLAIARHDLKLNVGCGHIPIEGFINVDRRDLPGVDIVAEATALPFSPGEIAELASAHLVEHFSAPLLERVVLPYWRDLLQTGGRLTVVAPDGDAMLAATVDGSMTFEDFREVLFGAQDYDGDYHFNLLTPQTMREVLERVGFQHIVYEYTGKRNGKCFEFCVAARKV